MPVLILRQSVHQTVIEDRHEKCTDSDLKHLQDWLAKQPHLISRNDEHFLLAFLRNGKFSLERAKEKLDCYHTVRGLAPEFFDNRNPFLPEIQEILEREIVTFVIDENNPTSPAVLCFNWRRSDPEKVLSKDVYKVALMTLDIVVNEYTNVIESGIHIINDCKGAAATHYLQSTPTMLKKLAFSVQDAYPLRLNSINAINAPSLFVKIASIIRPLLKEKLRKRFNIAPENEKYNFESKIPASVLPKEYGGTAGSLSQLSAEWRRKIESYQDWFLQDKHYGTDETKRPNQLSEGQGSFRKLDID